MFACSDTPASFFPITHLCFIRRTMTHARSTVRQSRSATSRTPHSRTARAATRALPCVTFSLPPLQHHRSGQRPTGPRWWWPERAQTVSCRSRSETQAGHHITIPLPRSLGFMFEESLVFGDLTWPPQTATSPTTGAEVRTKCHIQYHPLSCHAARTSRISRPRRPQPAGPSPLLCRLWTRDRRWHQHWLL